MAAEEKERMRLTYRYMLGDDIITTQKHDEPPPIGYEVTFIGRLGVPSKAEHFIVNARIDSEPAGLLILKRNLRR